MAVRVAGIDFTSSPSPRKPLTFATGRLEGEILTLESTGTITAFAALDTFLQSNQFDLVSVDAPLGMTRSVVNELGWPDRRDELIAYIATLTRIEFLQGLQNRADSKPYGEKEPKRLTERYAPGAFSCVKIGRPSMARMTYEAFRVLARNPTSRFTEAFPKLVQLALFPGARYKFATEPARRARAGLVEALLGPKIPHYYGFELRIEERLMPALIEDAMGDLLDAVFACVQAAWACRQLDPNLGIPPGIDPIEGWIVDPYTLKAFVEMRPRGGMSRSNVRKISTV